MKTYKVTDTRHLAYDMINADSVEEAYKRFIIKNGEPTRIKDIEVVEMITIQEILDQGVASARSAGLEAAYCDIDALWDFVFSSYQVAEESGKVDFDLEALGEAFDKRFV